MLTDMVFLLQQYLLIATVGTSFFFGLYEVMLNQRSGGAGGGVKA